MSITDELRKWLKSLYTPNSGAVKDEGERIADRIDAEHERQCAESWMRGHDAWAAIDRSDEMAEHGWIRLPKDADGEYIHIGDVMESGDGDVFTVSSVDYGLHPSNGRGKFWMLWNEDADFYECAYECRHHKQPTVEDVLREMHAKLDEVTALYVGEAIDSDERDSDEARIFAEYAEKLQLREDA